VNELALFAGAGGGLLGTHLLGWRPVCAVEIEPYCREILLRRQRDGVLPVFPIWDDVRTFDGRPWRGKVDVVTGGFPCQPFSVAGKGLGIDDPRNMWPDTIRVIREVGPRFCLLENVPGLLAHAYFGTIVGQLSEAGYRVRWDVVSAAETGAPHRRDRLWILADAEAGRGVGGAVHDGNLTPTLEGGPTGGPIAGGAGSSDVADADTAGPQGRECGSVRERAGQRASGPGGAWWDADPADVGDSAKLGSQRPEYERIGHHLGALSGNPDRWGLESGLGRVAHGVAHRVDRLRAIGNGQVPAVVVRAWEELTRDG